MSSQKRAAKDDPQDDALRQSCTGLGSSTGVSCRTTLTRFPSLVFHTRTVRLSSHVTTVYFPVELMPTQPPVFMTSAPVSVFQTSVVTLSSSSSSSWRDPSSFPLAFNFQMAPAGPFMQTGCSNAGAFHTHAPPS